MEQINENDQLLRERVYNNTLKIMQNANSEESYKSAADSFESLGDYKDAPKLQKECQEQVKIYHNNSVYEAAKTAIDKNPAQNYEDANKLKHTIALLQTILGWKDTEELVALCRQKIDAINVKEEARLKEARIKAEARRIAAAKAARIRHKIFTIAATVAVIALAIFLLTKFVIIPTHNYNTAIEAMENGDMITAYEDLIAMDGYKDSAEVAESIYEEYKAQVLRTAEIGDTVYFGTYQLELENYRGPETIEWLVLDKQDGKLLLISKSLLDGKTYNETATDVTWETCTLRAWLNDTFYNTAFNAEEQSQILTTTVTADANPSYDTDPGSDTEDRVFILSVEEADRYMPTAEDKKCAPTRYAISNGVFINYDVGYSDWWLRTPGDSQSAATAVNRGGVVDAKGTFVDFYKYAVRPAIWVEPAA